MNEPARPYFDRENKATDAIPGVSPGCTNPCRTGDGGQSWIAIASFCPTQTYDRVIVYCLLPAISNLRSFRASYRFSLER
jgi:hypothetical protein